MGKSMLILKNIAKTYHKNKDFSLREIDIAFPEKGIVSIVGESGSGKSTLANIICGIISPDEGDIYLNDLKLPTDLTSERWDIVRNKEIGIILQEDVVIANTSVYDNLLLSFQEERLNEVYSNEEITIAIMKQCNIEHLKYKKIDDLSGGEIKRVSIARAIINNTNIIIADEPTANLDKKNAFEIMDILKCISNERLVIIITHDTIVSDRYSNQIIELSKGTIKFVKDNNANQTEDKNNNNIITKKLEKMNLIDNLELYLNNNIDKRIFLAIDQNTIYYDFDEDDIRFEKFDYYYENRNNNIILEEYFKLSPEGNEYTEIEAKNKRKIEGFFKFNKLQKNILFFIVSIFTLTFFLFSTGISPPKSEVFIDKNIYEVTENFDYFYNVNSEYDFLHIEKNTISSAIFNIAGQNLAVNIEENIYFLPLEILKPKELIFGRLPEQSNEIVIDASLLDKSNYIFNSVFYENNIRTFEKLMNSRLILDNTDEFVIVGVSERNANNIYLNNNYLIIKSMFGISSQQIDIIDNFNNIDILNGGKYPEETNQNLEILVKGKGRGEKIGDKIFINGLVLEIVGFTKDIWFYNESKYIINANQIKKYYNVNHNKSSNFYVFNSNNKIPNVSENGNIINHYNEEIKTIKNKNRNLLYQGPISLIIVVILIIILNYNHLKNLRIKLGLLRLFGFSSDIFLKEFKREYKESNLMVLLFSYSINTLILYLIFNSNMIGIKQLQINILSFLIGLFIVATIPYLFVLNSVKGELKNDIQKILKKEREWLNESFKKIIKFNHHISDDFCIFIWWYYKKCYD